MGTALESLEVAEQACVQPDASGLEKVALADAAHIHGQHFAIGDCACSTRQVTRHPERPRDIHNAAERHQAKDGPSVGQRGRNLVHSAVAARRDDELSALGYGLAREIGGVSAALRGPRIEWDPLGA